MFDVGVNAVYKANPSEIAKFPGLMKQNRPGLKKLSSVGEGCEGVAVAEEEQQQEQSLPVSLSDMIAMFFQLRNRRSIRKVPVRKASRRKRRTSQVSSRSFTDPTALVPHRSNSSKTPLASPHCEDFEFIEEKET